MAQAVPIKRIVIARYKEDVSWVDRLPAGWIPTVVQKQTEELEGDMPNAGREPSSYFFAIAKHYKDIQPDDLWAFVQGNPFDHCPGFLDKLLREPDGYTPLGGGQFDSPDYHWSDGKGHPTHGNLPVKEKYEEWLNKPFPGRVEFTPGAQFMVRGRDLLKYPLEWYIKLMDDFTSEYNPYVAERLWAQIYAN